MPADVLGGLALATLIAVLLGVGLWACHRPKRDGMSEAGRQTDACIEDAIRKDDEP